MLEGKQEGNFIDLESIDTTGVESEPELTDAEKRRATELAQLAEQRKMREMIENSTKDGVSPSEASNRRAAETEFKNNLKRDAA